MATTAAKVSSVVAAGLLSAVTLGTFYLLRNYGPESTVQRFHTAALAADQAELAKLTLKPDSPNVVPLVDEIRYMARLGARPEVANVQRGSGEVIVQIVYRTSYREEEIDWFVRETRSSLWLVDADYCRIQRSW